MFVKKVNKSYNLFSYLNYLFTYIKSFCKEGPQKLTVKTFALNDINYEQNWSCSCKIARPKLWSSLDFQEQDQDQNQN